MSLTLRTKNKKYYSGKFLLDLNNSRMESYKLPDLNKKYLNQAYESIHHLIQRYNSDIRGRTNTYNGFYKNHSNLPIIRINGEFRKSEFLDILMNRKAFFDLKEGDVITNVKIEDLEQVFDTNLNLETEIPDFRYVYTNIQQVDVEKIDDIIRGSKVSKSKLDDTILLIQRTISRSNIISAKEIYSNNIDYFLKNNINIDLITRLYNSLLGIKDHRVLPQEYNNSIITFHTFNKFITNHLNKFYVR